MILSPCKDCMNRTIECHISCAEYKDWKNRLKQRNDIITNNKRLQYIQDKRCIWY